MSVFTLKATILSPVHIGMGEELRLGFDFMVRDGRTYRLNVDRVLEKYASRLVRQNGSYPLPGTFLQTEDFKDPHMFRYVLKGSPRSQKGDARLQTCIKDVYDYPYLPGSSIKGAMRTALAWAGMNEIKPGINAGSFDNRPKLAGQPLEKKLFGKDPNYDLLRALQVGDCHLPQGAKRRLIVTNAQVVSKKSSGSPIELEAIAPNTVFSGSLHIDELLFQPQIAEKLGFSSRKHWLDELMPRVQAHSRARIQELQAWFAGLQDAETIAKFYGQLADARLGSNQALMQLGWGSGWDSKTFWTHLQSDPRLFEKLVREYKMDRTGKRRRNPGDPFPASKRVAVSLKKGAYGDLLSKPAAPFGWVLLELEQKE